MYANELDNFYTNLMLEFGSNMPFNYLCRWYQMLINGDELELIIYYHAVK
jgi:hypothetical protein